MSKTLSFLTAAAIALAVLGVNIAWIIINYYKYVASLNNPSVSVSYARAPSIELEVEACPFVVEVNCWFAEVWTNCGIRHGERCQTFSILLNSTQNHLVGVTVAPYVDLNHHQFTLVPTHAKFLENSLALDSMPAISWVTPDSALRGQNIPGFDFALKILDRTNVGGEKTAELTFHLVALEPEITYSRNFSAIVALNPSSSAFGIETFTFIYQFTFWDMISSCAFMINTSIACVSFLYPYQVLRHSPRVFLLEGRSCRRKRAVNQAERLIDDVPVERRLSTQR